MKKNTPDAAGFTLLEMMVVVIIISILVAIALPSYQSYARRALASQAQEQVQQIAVELNRYKSRQFNYIDFVIPATLAVVPKGATGTDIQYNLSVVDGADVTRALTADDAVGQSWVIYARHVDGQVESFVMTSTGVRCKNRSLENITGDDISNISCGTADTGSETW